MHCKTEEDYIEYGKRLFREQQEMDKAGFIITDGASMAKMKWPLSVEVDGERDYRRGFQHGVCYAVRLIESLYRKGYQRPIEIANIISDFEYNKLMEWRYSAWSDFRGKTNTLGHPNLKIESWWDVRKRVLTRDGFTCVECGSRTQLQCDHIVPVNDGGLPTDDNLQTLCKDCNIEKGTK